MIVSFLCLMLCSAFVASDVVNVAYQKQAFQSSVYNGHLAAKGVDGNTNQDFFKYSCFETFNKTGISNWWYVDLQDIYILTEVKLFNRLDCCANRANNMRVLVGNSLDSLTEVAYSLGQIENIWSILMPTVTTGRYVRLEHNGNSHFHLCEVQVFARAAMDVVNMAYQKQAFQSSVYNGHLAAKGVDGNTNQDFFKYSCFETSNKTGTSNWWYVDLQDIYILTEVKLFNRLDCCANRANDIKVLVGNSLDNLTEVAFSRRQIDNIWSVKMSTVTTGQYVKLVHNGHAHFHLCEVQVFARAAHVPIK